MFVSVASSSIDKSVTKSLLFFTLKPLTPASSSLVFRETCPFLPVAYPSSTNWMGLYVECCRPFAPGFHKKRGTLGFEDDMRESHLPVQDLLSRASGYPPSISK
jgi:hypothetical protein